MKRFMIAAALLAYACTPPSSDEAALNTAEPSLPGVTLPAADRAGNRMEALSLTNERLCTSDGLWCAVNDGASVTVLKGGESIGMFGVAEPEGADEWSVWPVIIRIGDNDRVLVGITRTARQMYSGGGGDATQLVLYSVEGGAVNEVVRMPLEASSTIRACFDEDDETQRAGACHDEYKFVTRISLDEGVAEGAPKIILETAAGSYPGRVTRDADTLEAPPLTQADLVWAQDATCSYRRTYSQDADGLYTPDQPLPACADYLEP